MRLPLSNLRLARLITRSDISFRIELHLSMARQYLTHSLGSPGSEARDGWDGPTLTNVISQAPEEPSHLDEVSFRRLPHLSTIFS